MSSIREHFPSLLFTLLFTYAVMAIQTTVSAQSWSCEVPDLKERAYDEMLRLDTNEKAEVENFHLTYGIPHCPANATNEHLLHSLISQPPRKLYRSTITHCKRELNSMLSYADTERLSTRHDEFLFEKYKQD